MNKIALVTMGGTIDKDYFDALSDYKVVGSIVPDLLERIGSGVTIEHHEICRKDSLELTDEDRQALSAKLRSLDVKKILVTHGTDTMVQTAKALAEIQGKTIVLTGALKPALFKTTDAVFNIGCAVIAVQILEPGAYIVMNGCVFSHDRVRKNLRQGMFEAF